MAIPTYQKTQLKQTVTVTMFLKRILLEHARQAGENNHKDGYQRMLDLPHVLINVFPAAGSLSSKQLTLMASPKQGFFGATLEL